MRKARETKFVHMSTQHVALVVGMCEINCGSYEKSSLEPHKPFLTLRRSCHGVTFSKRVSPSSAVVGSKVNVEDPTPKRTACAVIGWRHPPEWSCTVDKSLWIDRSLFWVRIRWRFDYRAHLSGGKSFGQLKHINSSFASSHFVSAISAGYHESCEVIRSNRIHRSLL